MLSPRPAGVRVVVVRSGLSGSASIANENAAGLDAGLGLHLRHPFQVRAGRTNVGTIGPASIDAGHGDTAGLDGGLDLHVLHLVLRGFGSWSSARGRLPRRQTLQLRPPALTVVLTFMCLSPFPNSRGLHPRRLHADQGMEVRAAPGWDRRRPGILTSLRSFALRRPCESIPDRPSARGIPRFPHARPWPHFRTPQEVGVSRTPRHRCGTPRQAAWYVASNGTETYDQGSRNNGISGSASPTAIGST
jgi:hypothetical protein